MHEADSGVSDAAPFWLLGAWRLLQADPVLDFAPGVRMEFCRGGRLFYTVAIEGCRQVFRLIYRVDGDCLRTDNPAAPHATATRLLQGEAGVMILDFSGARAVFIREVV